MPAGTSKAVVRFRQGARDLGNMEVVQEPCATVIDQRSNGVFRAATTASSVQAG